MREDTKIASKTVRVLSDDEILAVSGGKVARGDGLGGLRHALGGGILGQIATEIVHAGRRFARQLPIQQVL